MPDFGNELEPFRAEVRSWIEANFPASLRRGAEAPADPEAASTPSADAELWRQRMGAKGWGVPTWPTEYGGGGLSPAEARIVVAELARAGAPNPIGGMGVGMFGPTLLEYGNEAQIAEHIPRIARGEVRWCQGFSEPGSGSDLASLTTKAEDKGDHFLVNGQKIWNSGGHLADWCFALVRTDRTRKHEGISFLLIDMRSPGVEARPIRMISGDSFFSEIFFTDVRVPKENLVGPLNGGWTIGKRLMQFERSGIGGASAFAAGRAPSLGQLAKARNAPVAEDGPLADGDLRRRITLYEMADRAFSLTLQRVAASGPSASSSILKNVSSQLRQERDELTLEIMGVQGLGAGGDAFSREDLDAVTGWLFNKCGTIGGGSQEIQDNIIAKRILGLPDHLSASRT